MDSMASGLGILIPDFRAYPSDSYLKKFDDDHIFFDEGEIMRIYASPSFTASLNNGDWRLSLKRFVRDFSLYLVLSMFASTLPACTSKPRLADHSFEFDTRTDSPDIELLSWRYGTSRHPGARSCPDPKAICTKVGQQAGISGAMRVGDDLYVKWRRKSTNEVFEQTVDLRDKLPRNIENHTIRFITNQSQLYVYLITPTKQAPNPCPSNERRLPLRISGVPDERIFSLYCSHKIIRLHPINGIVPTFN